MRKFDHCFKSSQNKRSHFSTKGHRYRFLITIKIHAIFQIKFRSEQKFYFIELLSSNKNQFFFHIIY